MIRPLVLLWALFPHPLMGQGPDDHDHLRIPRWLQLGVEWRGRAESGNAFDDTSSDGLYLNRLRFNVTVKPQPWMQFFVQAQDARVFSGGPQSDALRNTLDMRQAYLNLGRGETGWQLRIGRQELAVGDERLVGADSYWDSFGLAFDAIQIRFRSSSYQMNAFSGFRVQPERSRPDPWDPASRISGLSISRTTKGNGIAELYLLWKRGNDTVDLMHHPGHRDVVTPGIRMQGELPRSLDYNIEVALQRGHVVRDGIAAWAGHWESGWKPLGQDFGMRLSAEYNFASGDDAPSDGRHRTFDDLYPAGFNRFGMADPIAWRNIRYPAGSIEMPLRRHVTLFGAYRYFQLANAKDGLYPGGDAYLVCNPNASSTQVGSHVLISVMYVHSGRWKVYGGYGYVIPGEYLRQSGYSRLLRTAYLQSSFTF